MIRIDTLTMHTVLLVQSHSEFTIQISRLVMDGVVVRIQSFPVFQGNFLQKISDFRRVTRMEDVPKGPGFAIGVVHTVFHEHITA